MPDLPTGTVTLLFTDIEGSTLLLQQLGDRYADMLTECRHLLRRVFHEFRGYEVDTQGDAFFVAFARATDAISASVAAQRTLATYPWPEGVTVWVRMGLHTGEPVIASASYVGLDVHHAARITSAGHGGQVLLSQTTRDLVEHELPGGVNLRDLGEHRLKDLQYPGHLFQLVITGLPDDFPPLKTLDAHPNNLPIQPTSLIGREKEVAAVQQLLRRENVRLLTLTGSGGTGKTRLGLQVAAELSEAFSDGVYFVNLAPISDPELVVPAIAQTLDIKEIAEHPLLELLKGSLHWKQVLLLLDNFEQVVDAAVYVAELLAACPLLKVLVTSRAALHVRGEQEFAVPPLAVPDPKHLPDLVTLSQYEAIALFIQRAQSVKLEFQMTNTNALAIAEICIRLDGLPLAIELAAARIKVLPPQALLARLGQRLAVLTSGTRDVPARQQTLRNTIEWSYQLLQASEQRLFRRLSIFVGGCTLEAVCATLDTDTEAGQVLDRVASLIDKSLLQQTEQDEAHLLMLETIREYGLEALAARGEMEATQDAHAAYYLALAEQAEQELGGPQQVMWLERLEQEHDNLRAALSWSLEQGLDGTDGQHRELALRLGGTLRQFWITHAHLREGRTYLERILTASPGAAPALRARVLIAAADLALVLGDRQWGEALAEESLVICREMGDQAGTAFSLYELGFFATWRGEHALARSLLEESVALFRALGHKERLGWSVYALGYLDTVQGEYHQARACYEEALALFRNIGNKEGTAAMLYMLARVLFYFQGDAVTAQLLLKEGYTLQEDLGEKWAVAGSLNLLAEIALSQGDIATARSQAEEALVLNRELGQWANMAESLSLVALVEARQGNYPAARSLYEEILALARGADDELAIPAYLERLAEVVAVQGEEVLAARLWGAAKALREGYSSPLPPVYYVGYKRAVAATRAHLGERPFAAAWAEGRSMTLEQVLAPPEQAMVSTPSSVGQPSLITTKPSPRYPAGLTAREVEVLRLVAQGLTDAQVAEQLVISPRTVNTHLTSIYSKLDVDSRTAASRFAIEQRLV